MHEFQSGSPVELMKLEKIWTRTRFCSAMPKPKFEDNRNSNDRKLCDLLDDWLMLFFECASRYRLSQSDILELVWRFGPDAKRETVRFNEVCSRSKRPQGNAAPQELLSARRCRLVPAATARQLLIFTVSASSSHLASDDCAERNRLRLKLSRGPHVAGDLGQLEMTCPD